MVMKIQVPLFWLVTPRGNMVGYQHFGGPCCPHLLAEDGDNKVFQDAGILAHHDRVSQPSRPL